MAVFSLLGQRKDIDLRIRRPSKHVPFADRRQELLALQNALKASLKGSPRLLVLDGEAGLGKTRLLEQFQKSLNPDEFLWLTGSGQPYGQTMAFHPFFQMFKSYFQFSDNESFQQIQHKMQKKVGHEQLLPGLGQLVSFFEQIRTVEDRSEFINEGKKQEMFHALNNLLVVGLNLKPLIVSLDDMQWVDATTRDFLGFLFNSPLKGPLLVMCAGRSPRFKWSPATPHDAIRLKPLQAADALIIFHSALGTNRLLPAIGEKILSSAGGNPLFLTEIGQTLKYEKMIVCDEEHCRLRFDLEELTVPESIQEVLIARLDALPESGKKVCQLASIIGRAFSWDVLKHLVQDQQELKQGLLILEDEGVLEKISPDMGGRYTFRHQLMQEITYKSLLKQVRRRYHRLVAEAIEILYRDSLDSQFSFLSYHYYQAQEWHKALAYTLDAGLRARRSFACQEALTCFDRALDILKKRKWIHADIKFTQLYKWKGGMHFCLREMNKSRAAFQRMLSLAKKQMDNEVKAEAQFRLGWIAFYSHQPRSAENFLSRALQESETQSFRQIHLKACSFLGQLHSVLGRFEKARPLLIQSLDISRV